MVELVRHGGLALSARLCRAVFDHISSSARLPAAGREMKTQSRFHFSRSMSLIKRNCQRGVPRIFSVQDSTLHFQPWQVVRNAEKRRGCGVFREAGPT